MELAFESAIALAAKIRDKEISSRELTDYYIDRIERLDGPINAVPVHDFDRAREAADAADAVLAKGETLGPLHGLPMTIKEAYDITGLPTTWGNPAFKNNIAAGDAEVVKSFKGAGAHFIGKTNVPIHLGDFQSYNEIYGTTNNPWDVTRTPGGSSGGSAAALAAGFCALESGSDIGGSIRNPAHFCGVFGHKPTWGIVPPQGHALPGMNATADIAVVGPMARSAEDLALSMDIIAGPEPLNAPGWKLDLPKPDKKSLADFRVAIWPTDDLAPVAGEIADRVQAVCERLADAGAAVSDTAKPALDMADVVRTYFYMLRGVFSAGFSEDVLQRIQQQADAFDDNDRGMAASLARGTVQRHAEWLGWDNKRALIRHAWRDFFRDWDILICPQTATAAFPQDQSDLTKRQLTVDNHTQNYFQQIFWAGVPTVSYLPSTVFPTGPNEAGLPIGLQAVGAEYNDYTCIRFAELYAQEFGGFTPPPGF